MTTGMRSSLAMPLAYGLRCIIKEVFVPQKIDTVAVEVIR